MNEVSNEKFKIEFYSSEGDSRTWDNLTKMVCCHGKYRLGDKHDYNSNDFDSWEDFKKAIIKNEKAVIIKPLYIYDHGGITIATSPFSCRWDSGQVGFVFVTRETMLKEYGIKRITKKYIEQATKVLGGEVETYKQEVEGDVWGFNSENLETGETDSCGGFYGSDFWANGMTDHINDEIIEGLRSELEAEFGKEKK